MPIHRLRLRETTISVGYADFQIEAPDPDTAACILQSAYLSARAQGVSLIVVDDRQAQTLRPEANSSINVTFHLMNESGDEIAAFASSNPST